MLRLRCRARPRVPQPSGQADARGAMAARWSELWGELWEPWEDELGLGAGGRLPGAGSTECYLDAGEQGSQGGKPGDMCQEVM